MDEFDSQILVKLMKQLQPGFLPYDIFEQIARLAVLPIIEFVPCRFNNNGQVEVLLLLRSDNDPIWPRELHTPGTVILPTDNDDKIYKAFQRITIDELKGSKISDPQYVGSILHKSKRGMEQAQIFWVEVLGKPRTGRFYEMRSLLSNTIKAQLGFIKLAATSFKKTASKRSLG